MGTKLWLVAIFMVLAVFMAASPTYSIWSQQSRIFNVTPDILYLNWTQQDANGFFSGNITLFANFSTNITIDNSTTYSSSFCSSLNSCVNFSLFNNSYVSSSITSSNLTLNLTGTTTNTTNITAKVNTSGLAAGRYTGTIFIFNTTNITLANATVNVTLDVPLAFNATFLNGSVSGNISTSRSVEYYFFNITNANSLFVRANSSVDLFLYNSTGALVAKNLTQNASNRIIYYTIPFSDYNTFYSLRAYNLTSAVFGATVQLNPLNASSRFVDFGVLNSSSDATNSKSTNYTLNNTQNINLTNVSETLELFYFINYTNAANSRNFTVLFPINYSGIAAELEWNTSTDFNMTLYDSALAVRANQTKRSDLMNASQLTNYNKSLSSINFAGSGDNNAWILRVNGTGNYNLTIKLYLNATAWLNSSFGNYNGNYSFSSAADNQTVVLNLTVPSWAMNGIYNGTARYADSRGNIIALPFGVNVTVPTMTVNNSINAGAIAISDNIGFNKTVTTGFWINNTGTYNLSVTSILNTTALSWGANNISYTHNFTAMNITANNGTYVQMSFTINMTNASAIGYYNDTITIVSSNGRPYRNFSLTLALNLTNMFNVNALNLTDTAPPSSAAFANWTNPGSMINLTVAPYYQNGSFVQNLNNAGNWSIWLEYPIIYEGSRQVYNVSSNITVQNVTQNANNYTLNVTINSTMLGGNFTVYAAARDNALYGPNSGTGSYSFLSVNQSLFTIDTNVTSTADSMSFSSGGTYNISLNLTNWGARSAASFNVSASASGCSFASGYPQSITSFSGSTTVSNFSTLYNGTAWQVTLSNGTSCTVTVTGVSPSGVYLYNDTATFSWSGSSSTTTTTTTTSTSTTTTTNTTAAATAITSNITITNFPTEIKISQNASGNATITVKSSGDTNLTGVKVYVDGINKSWYVQPAAQDIGTGVEKNFFIIFNIPASAPPLSYPVKYVANNSAASKGVSASLLVIPNNQTAAQIASNMSNYTQKYEQLSLLINQTKARGVNLSDAEASLNQAKGIIDRANAYIKAGDYFSAYQLASQIDGLLNAAEAKISGATQNAGNQSGIWVWAVVAAVIIAAAGFIAYLAMPPKHGFSPETGYRHALPDVRGKSRLEMLKKKAKDILEKIRNILRKKQQSKSYAYNGPQTPFVYKGPSLE